MIISHTQIPNGGWQYQQGNVLLIAETFDLLVKNVKAHRQSNGIVPGDVESDIENQIVDKFPELRNNNVLA